MFTYLPEITYALYFLFSQASPGPDQLLVTRTSLHYGVKPGVLVSLGIAVGLSVHCIVVCWVGSAVLQSAWGMVFYAASGMWILYLAWKIWPRGATIESVDSDTVKEEPAPVKGKVFFRDALLCNLMNPKCTLFIVALSSPLLSRPHGNLYLSCFVLLNMAVAFCGWLVWVFAFRMRPVQRMYNSHAVSIDRVFSMALLLFGCFLLYEVIERGME